jgi:geranylgeranyl diphosphate synthase, type II
MSEEFKDYHKTWKSRINRYFEEYFEGRDLAGSPLGASVTYSLLPGGKRFRALLAVAACEAFGVDGEEALPYACAVEMIHTFTLIHDDLPAMDGAQMRRDKPANHKVYGEGQAILAGDALLVEAFSLMSDPTRWPNMEPAAAVDVIRFTAGSLGLTGLALGQSLDLASDTSVPGAEELEKIYRDKTGKLFAVAMYAGAAVGGADPQNREALAHYGELLGLAFQIVDDVLDYEQDSRAANGEEGAAGKPTLAQLIGVDNATMRAEQIIGEANQLVENLGEGVERLRQIAEFVLARKT